MPGDSCSVGDAATSCVASGHFSAFGFCCIHFPTPPMARTSKKVQILEKQSSKRKITNEIAGIVQQLRSKPEWIVKISDPTIREKYRQEAIDQGLAMENIQKAFSILDTMAKCQPPRSQAKISSDDFEETEVIIKVGETNFTTTTKILISDSESMLNRMFSPPWLRPQNGEPTPIETPSNSPVIFDHILRYLTSLSNNDMNFCNSLNDLSSEELDLLRNDCDYFGFRRFLIALNVFMRSQEMLIAEDQKKSSQKLYNASRKLKLAREEKVALEKRLAQLPDVIAKYEQEEQEAEQERLRCKTRWVGQPGEQVMVNTSGQSWQECTLAEVDGQLVAQLPQYGHFGVSREESTLQQ
jgi:hypothetical protein